jgi:medium-chain acyl-[acyl-carrier-protein] hydrolase
MAVAEALLNGTQSRRVSGPGPILRPSEARELLPTHWITTPRPNPRASLRLILMADAGGSAATFRGWSDRLPTADVGIVQLPGRGARLHERFVLTVAEAAQSIADEVAAGAGNATVLFGHGLGALIAFETARRLTARHWPVAALFVSGQSAPSLGLMAPRVSDLPADEFVAQLRQRRHVLPATAIGDPDVLQMLLPIVRADVAIAESYRYEPESPLACPLIACDAAADPHASRTDVEGWKRETTGRFSIQRFGGDRSYIQREHEALTGLVRNHLSVMLGALARSAPVPR